MGTTPNPLRKEEPDKILPEVEIQGREEKGQAERNYKPFHNSCIKEPGAGFSLAWLKKERLSSHFKGWIKRVMKMAKL